MQSSFSSTILILDDDPEILATMELLFEDRVKKVHTASNQEEALQTLEIHRPDLMIMDMNYSKGAVNGAEGYRLLKKIREQYDLPVLIMTAYGEIDLVVECMKIGAQDFIQKPWSNQRLMVTVSNLLQLNNNEKEISTLKAANSYYQKAESDLTFGMVGSSNAMKLLRDRISRVAPSDANVLILGENGTGKELVAKAIHNQSHRNTASFIKVDLGSVHEQLFESEMFGAKKGAYTGIQSDKVGRMVMANGGTLFLDEIGNLPLSIQPKMLSALQNREIYQVGASQPEEVDIRLVSATNMTMNELLDDSKFRQDLLYRINTVEIHIPPLRERVDDIPELFSHFKSYYESKYQTGELRVKPNLIEKAQAYNWPGNVRELQHATERAVLMCTDGIIQANDLLTNRSRKSSKEDTTSLNLEEMEKRLIRQALHLHVGNMTKAAEELGLTRAALYRRIEKYGL